MCVKQILVKHFIYCESDHIYTNFIFCRYMVSIKTANNVMLCKIRALNLSNQMGKYGIARFDKKTGLEIQQQLK